MSEPIISDEILRRYQEHIIKKYRYGVNLHEIALVLAAQADLGSANEVTDEMVDAGIEKFDRDPDKHHETIVYEIIEAALKVRK